jgi:ribosomal protein S12 methylthiotransferase
MERTVGLVSLGCSKNRVDSEVMLGILAQNDFKVVGDPAQADVILVNTCGFIQSAKEESIEAILEMAQYKKGGRLKKLIVTGCLSQRYGQQIRDDMPEVDAILGVAEYQNLPEILEAAFRGERPLRTGECGRFLDTPRLLTTPSHSAYVKISDGCDNRCAYCAIPLIRGGYQSRPADSILKECELLAGQGTTELTLIAQDTSRYGNDLPGGMDLAGLLEKVSQIEGVRWVRALYCYQDTVDERLLDTIVRLPKVCKYLDLPLQHISGEMLRNMNRRGSPEHIRELIKACHARGILVRTTFIVGFPGETEQQFEEMLDFVRWARFGRLGAFTYSPEEGTAAAVMPDQIEEDVKQARLDRLMRAQQEISLALNQARVGETCEVLVESFEDGRYTGRSKLEAPEVDGVIRFKSRRKLKPGEYALVVITGAETYDLSGEELQ